MEISPQHRAELIGQGITDRRSLRLRLRNDKQRKKCPGNFISANSNPTYNWSDL